MLARSLLVLAPLGARLVSAITLNPDDATSIKSAASTVAHGLMSYYTGNETGGTPGTLAPPYYWWETGGMFGQVIDYWYYTGDSTYNEETRQAIQFQAGTDGSFMPQNQTKDEGNDDQAFWAFTALEAAELNFPAPDSQYPSWIAQGQAVFNKQVQRWDTATCGGGLRWQIFTFNSGYNYKNIAANGALFQISARLARYTGNSTYVDWAEKTWDWFQDSVLWNNATSQVYDGTVPSDNCTGADHSQWTYNYGFWIAGLAYLYNHTEDAKWLTPLEGIVDQTFKTFCPTDNIMSEITCEPTKQCDTDNYSFKAYTIRWLAVTTQLVPSLASKIMPYISANGVGAAGQCDGGSDGVTCGFTWTTSTWDGSYGMGQQMSALSAIQSNMLKVANLAPPFTANTGGTSVGDPSAGTGSTDADTGVSAVYTDAITTSDRAGAGILTALALILTLGGTAWLLLS